MLSNVMINFKVPMEGRKFPHMFYFGKLSLFWVGKLLEYLFLDEGGVRVVHLNKEAKSRGLIDISWYANCRTLNVNQFKVFQWSLVTFWKSIGALVERLFIICFGYRGWYILMKDDFPRFAINKKIHMEPESMRSWKD